MKPQTMYNPQNDPAVGVLEFIACWTLYFIGSFIHMVLDWDYVTLVLQTISFIIAIAVGVVNLLRAFGFDVNIKKRFKLKSKSKKNG